MQDVMVDLETLGNSAGCSILSIGAIAFDPVTGDLDEATYGVIIDRQSCVAAGLREDADTLAWWGKQASDVTQIIDMAGDPEIAVPLKWALCDFDAYLTRFGPDVRVWGNGADFDNPILAAAYRAAGAPLPWKFWNSRCYRTLKALRPEIKLRRIGSHHNAVDDAVSQAAHAIALLTAINRKPWWQRLFAGDR